MLSEMMERPANPGQSHLRPQGSWTYEDWLEFPNDGWRYEIIDGELYMTPPPGTSHQRISVRLVSRLNLYVEAQALGEVLEAPCGVRLPDQPVPLQPDIFFIRKENLAIIQEQEIIGVPDLIIEILSPSTASYDRTKKFTIYQEAAVPEYWLIDYQSKTIEVFVLSGADYRLAASYRPGDELNSSQLPGFNLDVATIFNF